jgi:aldose 1-epimerase
MQGLVEHWGEHAGESVRLFTLSNNNGVTAKVSNLGATLQSLAVPDASGRAADIVLGFDTPQEYLGAGTYFGATVGRYGNRIRRGRFTQDGREYVLGCNEGANHLHGGFVGYDKRVWATNGGDGKSIRFGLVSPAGDEGYPGTLVVQTTYSLNDDNELTIEMTGSVSEPSPVNLVHHSYFNLAGSGDVLGHEVEIAADFYTPADAELMPTGEIAPVGGTPFDFTRAKTIGRDIDKVVGNAGAGRLADGQGGYDHNWVLRGEGGRMREVVRARDPVSGRGFVLSTTEPGVHFYTGGYLAGVRGKGGTVYPKYAGFTLETQKFPDSPNIPHFPTSRVDPGAIYRHVMRFKFVC